MFWQFMAKALLGLVDHEANPTAAYDALAENEKLRFDSERPYWNYGLWRHNGLSMGDACAALCEEEADLGGLRPEDRVLDVGFGAGPQLEHWLAREPRLVVGLDRTAGHCRAAAERGLPFVLKGDGARLPFADASFDLLLCVEAAFHFDTRERFFKEAHRVLEPEGKLVLSDLAYADDLDGTGRLWWSSFSRIFHVPMANRVLIGEYEAHLESAGFAVTTHIATHEVVVPFFAAAARDLRRPLARWACSGLSRIFAEQPPFEYLFVVAQRR